MYRKLIILIIILIIISFSSISIHKTHINETKYINIEAKGAVIKEDVYTLSLGSNINDLLKIIELNDDADISQLAKNEVLYNNQIITIPKHIDTDLISINSASIDALSCLPGIGKSIALRIIEYRNTYGCFNSLEEIMNVNGIGEKKYEKIKELITL